ncbi:hypothetical protein [Corallococcus sp. CA047B]|uniref:hypothetical protein n=1 Tax=Corallococcus sp. CA047B TaxID=2316729 RepID=UPI0011C49D81|nr:hypothetical protein [Corallococcus sp. CA047B]
MHVQFDTDAFGKALDSESLSGALVEKALECGWSVSISQTVFSEVLGMDNNHYQLIRAQRLLWLRQRLGDRFFLAQGLEDLVSAELSGRVGSPLALSPQELNAVFGRLHDAVEAKSRDAGMLYIFPAWMEVYKGGARTRAVQTRRELAEIWVERGITAKSVAVALSAYSVSTIPDWIVAKIVREKERRARYQIKSIYARPKRFKALLGWSALANLTMFGELVPTDRLSGAPGVQMLKRGANDWYDAAVAASSAYCSTFVTNDKTLASRCDFLYGRGCLHFQTASLSDLLDREA